MSYYAKLIDSKIADIYESQIELEDFQKAFDKSYVFIDVTQTNASVGDLIDLASDGSFSLTKTVYDKEVFSVPDPSLQDLNEYKDGIKRQLEFYAKEFLKNAFLDQSLLHAKISTALEEEALGYKKTGTTGPLLSAVAQSEDTDINTVVNQILQTYDKVLEANNIVTTFYYKWKNRINSAESISKLQLIEENMAEEYDKL